MNTTLREFICNIETIKAKNTEIDFYQDGLSGNKLHELRISKKASERTLLDISRLTEAQKDGLAKCGTLCWCCQHSTDLECRWFQNFRPVPGWVAIPERCMNAISYMVFDCPNFLRTSRFAAEKEQYKEPITYKVDIADDVLVGNIRI
ncbi:hypothetical protein [Ruminococcus albus]|uniref:Uncharacterized protein n=1 Tax=Ruminococcus albus (strain ATCC 27210 / DSM 20455 / JCM 14654 / NCDO 2250 / 7) TaxID=697329 RepID=E6UJG7_RUMA7|nr:hypothetical protein [Ruminococcus albus]ADU23813.1 hypothetical protein Rumal_3351 [Ruminococcus albus 7 = DSM 20455]